MGLLIAQNPKLRLPDVGETVTITNAHFTCESEAVLCNKSELHCDFYQDTPDDSEPTMANVIREFKLGASDLPKVSAALPLELLRKVYANASETFVLQVLCNILISSRCAVTEFDCMNSVLPKLCLRIVSDYRSCPRRGGLGSPEWSFGVMHQPDAGFLFGFLYAHHKHAILILQDLMHKVTCLVIGDCSSKRLFEITDKFVVIKKYCVVSEKYKNVGSYECIIFDSSDVSIIDSEQGFSHGKLLFCGDSEGFPLKVVGKSTVSLQNSQRFLLKCVWFKVTVNSSKELECWLDVSAEPHPMFLRLNKWYLGVVPLLQPGQTYTISHVPKL